MEAEEWHQDNQEVDNEQSQQQRGGGGGGDEHLISHHGLMDGFDRILKTLKRSTQSERVESIVQSKEATHDFWNGFDGSLLTVDDTASVNMLSKGNYYCPIPFHLVL